MGNMSAPGMGQSSWGPTGFAIFPNETIAFRALKKIRDEWKAESRLRFVLSEGFNHQAEISVSEQKPSIKNVNVPIKNPGKNSHISGSFIIIDNNSPDLLLLKKDIGSFCKWLNN